VRALGHPLRVSRLALEETKFPVAHEAELLDGLDPYDQEDLRRLRRTVCGRLCSPVGRAVVRGIPRFRYQREFRRCCRVGAPHCGLT